MGSKFLRELGRLADPRCYCSPLDLGETATDTALRYYESMLQIRLAEEQIASWSADGVTATPCHLGIGQEAVAVGVSDSLTNADRVFGAHRSHSHFLALGGSLYGLFAEVLGKYDGVSRGMGGSMHLAGRDIGFGGSVPIVGATIPIAVGAALASKFEQNGSIAVAYFGDGAAEEGVLHESLNLAQALMVPVLFVCENNLFSSHLDIELRQPSDKVSRYAEAHRMENVLLDGNDVVGLVNETRRIVGKIREQGCPAFIEAVTYRHRGHVGPREDIDVGVRRSLDELNLWKLRDPLVRLENALVESDPDCQAQLVEIQTEVSRRIDKAAARAESSDYPPDSHLLDSVYA